MHVTIGDRTYSVIWRYDIQKRKKRVVSCWVRLGEEILAEGKTKCYKGDCFSKNTGRKISLSRALHAIDNFGKDVRTQFWDAYVNMRHGRWL